MSSELKVGDVMTKKVVVLEIGSSVVDAASLMKEKKIGSIIIVNKGKTAGIITDTDIVYKIVAEGKDPNKIKVEEIMSKPLRVIKPTAEIEEAAKAMKNNKIKRLPVVNDKNEVIGIITQSDIAKLLPSIVDLLEERALLR